MLAISPQYRGAIAQREESRNGGPWRQSSKASPFQISQLDNGMFGFQRGIKNIDLTKSSLPVGRVVPEQEEHSPGWILNAGGLYLFASRPEGICGSLSLALARPAGRLG